MNDQIQTDDSGRLLQCLHCGEENILLSDNDATYCIYCGFSLKNQCTNYGECGTDLPPNAAYCPYCGTETHFLKSGLVESKREEMDVLDDDLPF